MRTETAWFQNRFGIGLVVWTFALLLALPAWTGRVHADEDAAPSVWFLKVPLNQDQMHRNMKAALGEMNLAAYYFTNQGKKRKSDVLWLLPDTTDVDACVAALEKKDGGTKAPVKAFFDPAQPSRKVEKLSCYVMEKQGKNIRRPNCKNYLQQLVGFAGLKKPTAKAYCELAASLNSATPQFLADQSISLKRAQLKGKDFSIPKMKRIVKVPYFWNVALRSLRKRYKDLEAAAEPVAPAAQEEPAVAAAPTEAPAEQAPTEPSPEQAAPLPDPEAQANPADAVPAPTPTEATATPQTTEAKSHEKTATQTEQTKTRPVAGPPSHKLTDDDFAAIWGKSAMILALLGFLLGSFTLLMAQRTRRELIQAKASLREQEEGLAALQMALVSLKSTQEPDPHADEVFEKYIGQTDHGLGMPAKPKTQETMNAPQQGENAEEKKPSFEDELERARQEQSNGQSESQKIAIDVLQRQQEKEANIVELARKEEAGELRFVPAEEPEPQATEGEPRPLTDLLQSEINKPDGVLGRTEDPKPTPVATPVVQTEPDDEEEPAPASSGETGFETILPMEMEDEEDTADTQAVETDEIQGRLDETIELGDEEMIPEEEETTGVGEDDHAEKMELGKPIASLFEYLNQIKERWPNAPAWWHPFFDQLNLVPTDDEDVRPSFASLMNDFTQSGQPVGTQRMKEEWDRWVIPYRAYWLIQHFAMPQVKAKAPAQIKLVSGLAVRLADVGRWILQEEQKRGLAHHNLHWFETIEDIGETKRVLAAAEESPLMEIDWVRVMVKKLYASKAPGTLFDVTSWGFDSQSEIRPSRICLLPTK